MAVDARQLKPAMMILLCVSTSTWAEPGDDSLPPPPQAQALNGEAVFQLSIVLNHYDTGMVVPVTQREGAFFISSADLLRAGLPPEHVPAGDVNLSTLPQVRVEYDSAAQRLLLGVPADWVASRVTPFSGQMSQSKPHFGRGALLNYDLYTNHTEHVGGQASLWHEFRYFNENGSFSSTGYARENFTGNDGQQEGYVRYDTTLLMTNEDGQRPGPPGM